MEPEIFDWLLPKNVDYKKLSATKGKWPKRDLSKKELLDVYKKHYSFGSKSEYLSLLMAFKTKYGSEINEIIEDVNYKLGKEAGKESKAYYKNLLNFIVDLSVRPFCYEIDHIETSGKRIVFKVLNCPFADMAKKMNCVELASHVCPRWHEGFAESFGYRFEMPQFALKGDSCCEQKWVNISKDSD